MALDELVQKNNVGGRRGGLASKGRGRGRGKGSSGRGFVHSISGPGPDRRLGSHRGSFRCRPYAMPLPLQVPNTAMPVLEPMIVHESDRGEGTMLYLSNLHYGVTNQDIKLLFSDIGELKRYSINYDKSGRSKGTGEVVYAQRRDALTAMNKYNNVQLDGKPLQIEMIGVKMVAVLPPPLGFPPPPAVFPPPFNMMMIRPNHPFVRGEESLRARQANRGGGIGRGQAQGQRRKVSAEELDAELDLYRFEAMKLK